MSVQEQEREVIATARVAGLERDLAVAREQLRRTTLERNEYAAIALGNALAARISERAHVLQAISEAAKAAPECAALFKEITRGIERAEHIPRDGTL